MNEVIKEKLDEYINQGKSLYNEVEQYGCWYKNMLSTLDPYEDIKQNYINWVLNVNVFLDLNFGEKYVNSFGSSSDFGDLKKPITKKLSVLESLKNEHTL